MNQTFTHLKPPKVVLLWNSSYAKTELSTIFTHEEETAFRSSLGEFYENLALGRAEKADKETERLGFRSLTAIVASPLLFA